MMCVPMQLPSQWLRHLVFYGRWKLRQVRVTFVYNSLISIYNIALELSHFWGAKNKKKWHLASISKRTHTNLLFHHKCSTVIFHRITEITMRCCCVFFFCLIFALIASHVHSDIMTANDQKGNEWQTLTHDERNGF